MFMNQYEEHVAHSAPCNSRFDGFDRGTSWADEEFFTSKVIGRMTNGAGQRVEIVEECACGDTFHKVIVDGGCVFFEEDCRARAVAVARWWMNGCPA